MTNDVAAIIDKDIDLLDAAAATDDDDAAQERDAKILLDGVGVKRTGVMKGAPTSGLHAKHRIIISLCLFLIKKNLKMKDRILGLVG